MTIDVYDLDDSYCYDVSFDEQDDCIELFTNEESWEGNSFCQLSINEGNDESFRQVIKYALDNWDFSEYQHIKDMLISWRDNGF